MKPEKYIAFAQSKDGQLFIGGVKQWQSAPQDTRQAAKDVMAGYLDGQQHAVRYSLVKPTFNY